MAIDSKSAEWLRRVGANIRTHRKLLNLKLDDLSRISGVGLPALSNIENGNRDVKLSTLVRLSHALRLDLPELFALEEGEIETNAVTQGARLSTGYDLGDD